MSVWWWVILGLAFVRVVRWVWKEVQPPADAPSCYLRYPHRYPSQQAENCCHDCPHLNDCFMWSKFPGD